ncbi:acyl-CoA dehydrogenase family protein [Mycolicibacterium elephantis]
MSENAATIRSSLAGVLATGLTGAALKSRLLNDGWFDIVEEEPQIVLREMFSLQGRMLAHAAPTLDLVALQALSAHGGIEQLLHDASTTAILYPVQAHLDRYLNPVCGEMAGGRLQAHGLTLAGFDDAQRLILPIADCETMLLVEVDPRAGDVRAARVAGIDDSLGLHVVRVTGSARVLLEGNAAVDAWRATTAATRHALSYELIGLARQLLERATEHVSQRRQFGRPIGSFQAVRHQLAEVHVAIESADLSAEAAWETRDPMHLAVTKALAADAHRCSGDASLQTHGAIGFTTEYGLHRFMRRGWALSALTGSTRQLDAALGHHLSKMAHAPRFGSLATQRT